MPDVSLTDRVWKLSDHHMEEERQCPPDADWGIDTVALSLVVNPEQCDLNPDLWLTTSTRNLRNDQPLAETFTTSVVFGGSNVRVTLYTTRNVCHLSFNAARLISPKSATLLPPAALQRLVQAVLDDLTHLIWPAFVRVTEDGEIMWDRDWSSQVRIRRIDVARNFVVSDPEVVKTGLRAVKARNQKTHHEYTSGTDGWTLENTTKASGSDRIYDKSADLARWEPEERLYVEDRVFRFETQIQKDRLNSLRLKTLADVTDVSAWNALEQRWEATGWGCPLPGSTGLFEAVSDLSVVKQEGLFGYLHLAASGHTGHMTAHHVRERDRLAKSYGLTPGVPVSMLGAPDRRLDLLTGRIVSLSDEERLRNQAPV